MSLAIITGASSGIGMEFARQLRGRGIDEFWLIARREDKLLALSDELGYKCKVIVADLATDEGIEVYRSALEGEKPQVKYLINAAGFGVYGAFDEVDEDTVKKMIDLNVKALVLLTHMTVPYMERGGRIVQMGSGSCFTPLPYFNIYSSSKVFVLHYTKSLNYELKKYGVRATCFCPGYVETEFLGKAEKKGVLVPREYKPLIKCDKVVSGCIDAMERGKVMYVTNWYTKLQHLLFKILPDNLLSEMWLGMLKKND